MKRASNLIDEAINEILSKWDDWEATAGQMAQIDQRDETYVYVMTEALREVLTNLVSKATGSA